MSKIRTPNDYFVEIQKGNISGHSTYTLFGSNDIVSTTEELVSPNGNLPYPSAQISMTISSDNSGDNQAGTGVRSVLINGLDINFNEVSEVLAMHATDGQLGATTVNTYYRINQLVAITAGSNEKNLGVIYIGSGTITGGVPANSYNCITIGANLSHMGRITIPAGKTAYEIQAAYTGESNKTMIIRVYQRPPGGLFYRTAEFNVAGTNLSLFPLRPVAKIVAGTDAEWRGLISAGTGSMKAVVTFIFVDD